MRGKLRADSDATKLHGWYETASRGTGEAHTFCKDKDLVRWTQPEVPVSSRWFSPSAQSHGEWNDSSWIGLLYPLRYDLRNWGSANYTKNYIYINAQLYLLTGVNCWRCQGHQGGWFNTNMPSDLCGNFYFRDKTILRQSTIGFP